ncbi:MAG TPA: hypothetical protein VFQ36_09555 [Ktedonobacteraceae bacterium]|nr:hypothetical protein [Ktedonobacteraceae bacterium]
MPSKFLYAFAGLLMSGIIGILINLLSAIIQQQAFSDQFSTQSIWLLISLIVMGTLVGTWLGGKVNMPSTATHLVTQSSSSSKHSAVTITRLRALLSYGKLRGKGIHLSDIILFGSRIDIDTKE